MNEWMKTKQVMARHKQQRALHEFELSPLPQQQYPYLGILSPASPNNNSLGLLTPLP